MNEFPPPPPGGQPPSGPDDPTRVQYPVQPPAQGGHQQPVQQPGMQQPSAPQGQYQPPVDPLAAADKKRKQQLGVLAVVALLLIGGAFIGGKALEAQNYKPGKSGWTEIYDAGARSGKASGQRAGEQAGEASGIEKGKQQAAGEATAAGASSALGGFSNWQSTAPYAVTMAEGTKEEVPWVIESRTQMQPGVMYKICDSGSGLCTDSGETPGGPTGQ